MLPTDEAIRQLHKKYAPSDAAFDLVFTHCRIVWEIAQNLIEKSDLKLDERRVKAGCLLHDIGVYRLYLLSGEIDHKNYIKHGILGYELLKEEGYSEALCRIASCHTGVGLSKEEIQKAAIPIPPADYFAETTEEQLIMYADKFHTKTNPPTFMVPDTYIKHIRKFGEEKVARFKALQSRFGVPDIEAIASKYHSKII